MKRYMLNLVALFAAFMLSACGGGGGTDDTASSSTSVVPSSAVSLAEAGEINLIPLNTTTQDFNLQVRYVKNLNDNYLVTVDTQNIEISGCTIVPGSVVFSPAPVVMDQNTNSTVTLSITGQVDSACTNTSDYTLTGDVTIKLGDQTSYEVLNVSSNSVTDSINSIDGGYALTSVTTPIEINNNDEIKTISAVVVDENGVGVQDINVSITAVTAVKYGEIISASIVKTDQSGRAIFTYKAPSDIATVNGESTSVRVFLSEDNTISKEITINFNKIDENLTIPLVVIANTYKEINLTQNSQNANIEVQVFEQGTNTPYTTGNVKVILPDNVLQGVDVGSFTEYSVAVGSNGIAVFNYTGPQDLKALIDANETSATFKFFHEENPTQIETATVFYDLQTGYIPANYTLTTSSEDGNQTMNLTTLKTFTLYLKDDQGTLIDDEDINAITITSQNTAVGKLIDLNTGQEATTLTFNGIDAVNSKSFNIQSNTLSGLLPIEIRVDFTDANGNSDFRTVIMNVVVLSGPPTAMSISYAGAEQDSTVAKYTEKFVVTVTDAYNNPVNTNPFIATGAIVEYAVDGSSVTGERTTTSPRLWHGTDDPRGTIEAIGENKAQFTTTSDVFNYVDINNDRLVVFGAGYVYEALGKWDLASVAPQLLELKDDYYGITRSDLGFAVGHNNRQDLCSGDQREYVGNMKSKTYQIDENGHALIEFEYDYHLTGKDIMVWVNLTGFQADNNQTGRIGEAQKHTLRGNGLVPVPSDGYSIEAGTTAHVSFAIHHENAPEWYINGKFGWSVKSGSNCSWSIDYSSNWDDARTCDYGGSGNNIAHIDFTIAAPADTACTFAIDNINVATEFTGVNTH